MHNSEPLMMSHPDPVETAPKPKRGFRVIHTSDWHLGKLLGEHSREDEHRRFLEFLLQAIQEQSVDALLIAGDVFDSANPPQSAVAQYYDFLSALYRQCHCSVVIVAGNHDSPAHLEAPRQVLKALRAYVVGALPDSPADSLVPLPSREAPELVVAAVPFLRDRDLRIGQSGQGAKEIEQELVQGIKRRYEEIVQAASGWLGTGLPLLATGHLTVKGSSTSESEREIHVGGLGSIPADCLPGEFAYIGLGHLHRNQAVRGRDTMRYSGSPIPLSFSESDDLKELRLLDFADGKLLQQCSLNIPLARQLAHIRSTRASLDADLKAFRPSGGNLRPWVKVEVADPGAGENLYDVIQELAAGCEFEVIQVAGSGTARAGTGEEALGDPKEFERLMDDPSRVFARRVEAETTLSDEERQALKTAFAELRNLHAERQCDETQTPATSTNQAGGAA